MPETPTTCWFIAFRVWHRDGLGVHTERSRNALILVHPLLWAKEWHDKAKEAELKRLKERAEEYEGWRCADKDETRMTFTWWTEVPIEYYEKVQVRTQDGQLYCPWT